MVPNDRIQSHEIQPDRLRVIRDSAFQGALLINGREVMVPFATNLSRMGILTTVTRRHDVCQAIIHHDACFSAARCFDTLKFAGISTHFCVDNDSTVWQFADPALRVAWHAKGHIRNVKGQIVEASFNWHSVGVDISNRVVLADAGKVKPPRDVATIPVQGKPYTGLLPYPRQIETTLDLLRVIREHFPMITTSTHLDLRWVGTVQPATPGIWGHCHVSRAKIDPFGFPFGRVNDLDVAG